MESAIVTVIASSSVWRCGSSVSSSRMTANTIEARPRGPNQPKNAMVGRRAPVPSSASATGSIRIATGIVSQRAEQKATGERGDEDAPAQRAGNGGGEQRRGEAQDLQPLRLNQPPARGDPQGDTAERSGADTADEPVADLLEHELGSGMRRGSAGIGLGDGDRDEEQRHAQPVVKSALHVESLTDPGRDALV